MRVVVDTNVIVSAFLSPSGAPAQLLHQLEQDAFVLLVSEPILAEYQRALSYAKVRALHGMTPAAIVAMIDDLRTTAVVVEPGERLDVIPQDRDDNKFFECATAGDAAYIVSGDARVQAVGVFRGIAFVVPSLFLQILSRELG